MSNSVVEDAAIAAVLMGPVVAVGAAVGVAAGAVALTGRALVLTGDVLATLEKDFGSGVTDVLKQMQEENQQRLKLEQEWITQIRAEREKAFQEINSYVASLVKLSETDRVLTQLADVPGADLQIQSLIQKREARVAKIRQLRDRAIRSKNIDEIAACAEAAKTLLEGLPGELQTEMVFFAKNGVQLPEYGSLHDDAIRMALAQKNEVANVVILQSVEENQVVTEEMIRSDEIAFLDCLSEFMCEDGMNDRQMADLLAIKQELLRIVQNNNITPDIKKKRLATLFRTFEKRRSEMQAELSEMHEYYEAYLLETYDIPDERLELEDFDSVDEIIDKTREAAKSRDERLKRQYVQIQMDRIMKKHGLNVVDSAVIGRKEDDKRVLYGIDDSAAVDVFISDKGIVSTHVVGVNFGSTPTAAEEEQLVQKEHKFCSKLKEIEDDLEDVGIILRRKRTVPPDRNYSTWIQLDRSKPVQRGRVNRRKRRQSDNKVMYME